jgi:hypothetical protein
MLGFLMLLAMLLTNVFACGVLFFAGQTGVLLPLSVLFFVLYGLTAFRAGRGVVFRSPLAPRDTVQQRRSGGRRVTPDAKEFGLE